MYCFTVSNESGPISYIYSTYSPYRRMSSSVREQKVEDGSTTLTIRMIRGVVAGIGIALVLRRNGLSRSARELTGYR